MYNALGEVMSPTDARGVTTTYDSLARPVQVQVAQTLPTGQQWYAMLIKEDRYYLRPIRIERGSEPMMMRRLFALVLFVLWCSSAMSAPACPPERDLRAVLAQSGLSGALDADLKPMGRNDEYCFVRYEFVFGSAKRMASRLVIFRHGKYIGSYAVGFKSISVERDRVVLDLTFGGISSISFEDIGKDLLIDGEIQLFYK